MAISPAQARAGNLSKLSEDERQRLEAAEKEIDERVTQMFTDFPNSLSVSTGSHDWPPGYFTPAMTETLIARYKALGWSNVQVHESDANYSVQVDL